MKTEMNTVEFQFTSQDEGRKKAIYLLAGMKLKGFVSEHGTEGLYWFNTVERMADGYRDLLVSATDVKVLI